MKNNSTNDNRFSFGTLDHTNEIIPDLLAIQLASHENFLQEYVLAEKRKNQGLQSAFKTFFPVEDSNKNYILEFNSYYLGLPKYTEKECLERRLKLFKR